MGKNTLAAPFFKTLLIRTIVVQPPRCGIDSNRSIECCGIFVGESSFFSSLDHLYWYSTRFHWEFFHPIESQCTIMRRLGRERRVGSYRDQVWQAGATLPSLIHPMTVVSRVPPSIHLLQRVELPLWGPLHPSFLHLNERARMDHPYQIGSHFRRERNSVACSRREGPCAWGYLVRIDTKPNQPPFSVFGFAQIGIDDFLRVQEMKVCFNVFQFLCCRVDREPIPDHHIQPIPFSKTCVDLESRFREGWGRRSLYAITCDPFFQCIHRQHWQRIERGFPDHQRFCRQCCFVAILDRSAVSFVCDARSCVLSGCVCRFCGCNGVGQDV